MENGFEKAKNDITSEKTFRRLVTVTANSASNCLTSTSTLSTLT